MTSLQERLFAMQDKQYAAFQAKLTPGVPVGSFIGIRVPILRKFAKEFTKEAECEEFLHQLPHEYYLHRAKPSCSLDTQQDHQESNRELQNHTRAKGIPADIEDKIIMTLDNSTYYVWIGGSCDYGHKERAGGAAVVIEHNGNIISRDVISDLHTTEFRMMLTLMVKVMQEIPEGSDILFLTNAAYIQNFDKTPTSKSANPDLIIQCIEEKKRHNSVGVKIVQYHKSPLLIETHDMATEAMAKTRKEILQRLTASRESCQSC